HGHTTPDFLLHLLPPPLLFPLYLQIIPAADLPVHFSRKSHPLLVLFRDPFDILHGVLLSKNRSPWDCVVYSICSLPPQGQGWERSTPFGAHPVASFPGAF